jgi:hypothetical protein
MGELFIYVGLMKDFLSQEGLTKQLRGFSTVLVFGRASIQVVLMGVL